MSFDQLPDESIQLLLHYIPPEDNLGAVQLLSRRFKSLADEPLLWRYHCRASFEYWDPEHEFPLKNRQRASEVDWKALFILRLQRNAKASRLLTKIVDAPITRTYAVEELCLLGYDVKEFLLEQSKTPDTAEDVLARRYFANLVLGSIHRGMALSEWSRLGRRGMAANPGPTTGHLERILGGYDMFVLYDQKGDINEIGQMLDDLTSEFQASQSDLTQMTTRQKTLALVRWLHAKNLTGLYAPERSYRNLRNCLIGQALRHEDHESIPVISSAIFCCIAERLGLDAHCCAFPAHVYAMVIAPPGQTIDDVPLGALLEPQERMYLDPFSTAEEIPIDTLRLGLFGMPMEPFFEPVSPAAIGSRTSKNIQATNRLAREVDEENDLTRLMHGISGLNMVSLLYAGEWAYILLIAPGRRETGFPFLEMFLASLSRTWPEDIWLVKRFLKHYGCELAYTERTALRQARPSGPRYTDNPFTSHSEPEPSLPIFRRNVSKYKVTFKIGQVFRHKRYRWLGVIVSWFLGEENSPNPIDEGATEGQCYFRCMLQGAFKQDMHVIADDNIVPIDDSTHITEDMFPMAGAYFRRFDPVSRTFVSNLQAQYPDD